MGVAAVLIAVTGLLLAREIVVQTSEPFEWGSVSSRPQVEGVPERELPGFEPLGQQPEPMEVVRVPFFEGKHLRFAFSFRNAAAWGVTLEEVRMGPRAPAFATLLQPEEVLIAPREGWTMPSQAEPFTPTYFPPGEERLVVFDYSFACQRGGPDTSQIRDSIEVEFSMFGRSAVQEVPLPFRLVLGFPDRGSCTPLH